MNRDLLIKVGRLRAELNDMRYRHFQLTKKRDDAYYLVGAYADSILLNTLRTLSHWERLR